MKGRVANTKNRHLSRHLYLQVLSQVQTTDVVRLLLLPAELHSGQVGCNLRISAGGRVRAWSFESAEKAINNIRATKFNQLEVAYSIPKSSGFRLPGTAVSVVGVFTASPTCEVWFKAEDWPVGGERAMRTRKMNAKAAEAALSYYNVRRKPSIYEVAIEMDSSDRQDRVLDAFAEWLARFIPRPLDPLAVFGCVDAGGSDFFVKLESNVLMTDEIRIMAKLLPPSYPDLGQRFDALHPVMFGSKKVCNGIGSALGKGARVISGSELSNFAVVRLSAQCVTQAARRRVSAWILASAESGGVPPRGE